MLIILTRQMFSEIALSPLNCLLVKNCYFLTVMLSPLDLQTSLANSEKAHVLNIDVLK